MVDVWGKEARRRSEGLKPFVSEAFLIWIFFPPALGGNLSLLSWHDIDTQVWNVFREKTCVMTYREKDPPIFRPSLFPSFFLFLSPNRHVDCSPR